jgi:hypothetical protein
MSDTNSKSETSELDGLSAKLLNDNINKLSTDLQKTTTLLQRMVEKHEEHIKNHNNDDNAMKALSAEVSKLSNIQVKVDNNEDIKHTLALPDAIQLLFNKVNPTMQAGKFNRTVETWLKFITYIVAIACFAYVAFHNKQLPL